MDPASVEKGRSKPGRPKSGSRMVERRSSKQSSSHDRHGRVFGGDEQPSTIRTVTPEATTPGADTDHSSLPTSPVTRTRLPHRRREHSTSVSNTDEEGTVESRRRKSRSRTADNPGSDASPSSFITKTRQRIGSITTNAPFLPKADDHAGSIGFPSITETPSLPSSDSRARPPITPRRSFPRPASNGTINPGSPSSSNADSSRILDLMTITCGRMHGILFFRTAKTAPWESGYCAINVATGSLVCQVKGDITMTKTLIPDLRGCSVRTQFDQETQGTYLNVVTASSGLGVQLRPPVPETFDSWLAALLCWQPLRPKGIQNKMTKPQPITLGHLSRASHRRISDVSVHKGTAVIKVGNMLLWRASGLTATHRTMATHDPRTRLNRNNQPFWRRVSCTLQDDGKFQVKPLGDTDVRHTTSLHLSTLCRCAVQLVDPSVLSTEYCIAIYPQYSVQTGTHSNLRPLFLALESRVPQEAWYVLLRAFTVPELYGPELAGEDPHDSAETLPQPVGKRKIDGMFRVERSLVVRVIEAKLKHASSLEVDHEKRRGQDMVEGDFYGEIILDRYLRGRTVTKTYSKGVFWAEEFSFHDLPPVLSSASVLIKVGDPAEKEWTTTAGESYDMSQGSEPKFISNGLEVSSHDTVHGKFEIQLEGLDQQHKIEKWWPISDRNHRPVGNLLMKLQLEETFVLMEHEYAPLAELLHNFDNSLTTQLAQVLQSDIKQLSDILLDIFQVSNSVTRWVGNLVEEEIDGIYRETPPTRMRFSGRIHSNDSYETAENRELLVRDLSRSATMEANLLFRGNSLLTRALDTHMRRLGKEYLEETLGDPLHEIVERDHDCEVDPVRVRSVDRLEQNWSNLLTLTGSVWQAISNSADRCPSALRLLFRHIRSCAEDRYGNFIRTVAYSSVSGFLFLRFFCPAILNPKLFGLIKDHPAERPRRTLTLVAKSLIGLANLTKFGTKEPWMEPMNKFLVAATPDFKKFIDEICSVDSQTHDMVLEPQYTTPVQMKGRLPPSAQEGYPSLPFLLDAPKLYANLVTLWTGHCPKNIADGAVEDALHTFHRVCLGLKERTRSCLDAAEQAATPEQDLEPTWERLLAERRNTVIRDPPIDQTDTADDSEVTALPTLPPGEGGRPLSAGYFPSVAIDNPFANSFRSQGNTPPGSALVHSEGHTLLHSHFSESQDSAASSKNSSTLSLGDDHPDYVGVSSRDGSAKNRRFDLKGVSMWRRNKYAGRSQISQDDVE